MRRFLVLLLGVISIHSMTFAQESAYVGAAWSSNGSMLTVATSQTLTLYDMTSTSPQLLWSVDWAGIPSMSRIAFNPDDTMLATGHAALPIDSLNGRVEIWNAANGERLASLEGNFASVYSLAFDRTGSVLAVGSGYYRFPMQDHVTFWNTERWFELTPDRLQGDWGVHDIAFSPDGRWMAYSTERSGVYLVETTYGTPVALISIPRTAVEFSSDSGSLWLLTSEYQLQEWNIRETPEIHLVANRYCRGSFSICLNTGESVIGMSGNWYVTANRTGRVTVSHLPDGNNHPQFTHVEAGRIFRQAIISPDETRILLLSRPLETTRNDEVAIWTLLGGEYIKLDIKAG